MAQSPAHVPAHGPSCREVAAQSTAFLDRRLTPIARAQVDSHAARCFPCRTYIEQLALIRTALTRIRRKATLDPVSRSTT